MKSGLSFCLFVVLLASAPRLSAQKVQIPVDEESRIERITPELESKLGLFPEYPEFIDARLFQLPDSTYSLEIEYAENSRAVQVERPMSREQMLLFRRSVSERLLIRAPEASLDQEGRTEFITGTTLLAAGYYGWAIPEALDMEGKSFIATYMLTAGSGFLIPFLATKQSRVTEGMSTLALQGGLRGIVDGWLLSWLFEDDITTETAIGISVVASVAELCAGYVIADNTNMSAGKAGTISVVGNYGLGIGLGTFVLASDDEVENNKLAPVLGLLGTGAGYAMGNMMANSAHYTSGDVSMLAGFSALGALVPPSILSLTNSEDPNLYIGAAIAGCVGGMVLGHGLLRSRDFTTSQGNLTTLATLAGGLAGLGIAFLASGEDTDASVYALLGSGGATLGFLLMFNGYSDEAEAASKASSWNISLSPAGLFTSAFPSKHPARAPLPILVVTARF